FVSPEMIMAAHPSFAPATTDMPMLEQAPMMEQVTPEPQPQQASTNGLIGAEPTDAAANANSFLDMSNMFDSPVQDMPAETEQNDLPAAQETVNPAPADNGILSDAFIDPAAMFESPVSDTPAEQAQPNQPAETSSNPNDAMLDINPFNFIDPE
ncbi:MAG: hypothetical protein K2K70_08520, partial [Lachnospiraceae bacterium]|nr:hypothetical protein [Lachnospiraceae bacterium]